MTVYKNVIALVERYEQNLATNTQAGLVNLLEYDLQRVKAFLSYLDQGDTMGARVVSQNCDSTVRDDLVEAYAADVGKYSAQVELGVQII